MNELARIRFVIALGFTLEPFLDGLLDLVQALQTIPQRLESLIVTVMWRKFLESRAFQYVINRWTADVEAFRQMCYLPQPGLI